MSFSPAKARAIMKKKRQEELAAMSQEEKKERLLDIAYENLGKPRHTPKPASEIKTTEDFMEEVMRILR